MKLNKDAISKLLSLDDATLSGVIRSIAAEAGVDPAKISLGEKDIANIRAALSVATNDSIAQLYDQFIKGKK